MRVVSPYNCLSRRYREIFCIGISSCPGDTYLLRVGGGGGGGVCTGRMLVGWAGWFKSIVYPVLAKWEGWRENKHTSVHLNHHLTLPQQCNPEPSALSAHSSSSSMESMA
ncbi:unnamed protein product [Boreogadus saida]